MAEELHKHAEREMFGDLLNDDATLEEAQAELDAANQKQDTGEHSEEAAQPDTESDTGQPDTEEETGGEEERPDMAALWEKSELAKRYGSVEEAERALLEKEQYISRLTNQLYNRPQAQPQQPAQAPEPVTVDPDAFLNDPVNSIKRMGYVSKQEAAQIASDSARQIIEEERIRQFFKEANDFESLRPKMQQVLLDYPELEHLPQSQSLRMLYRLAKSETTQSKPPVQVEPSDKSKKDRAKTSGGRSQPTSTRKKPTERTKEEWLRMSDDEIEKEIGFSDV